MPKIDLTGYKNNRLTVLDYSHNIGHKTYWNCRCDCGNEKKVRGDAIKDGNVKSCGCLKHELDLVRNKTHGLTGTTMYRIWNHMKDRCLNENSGSFHHYGGRGITVCDSWLTFENFYADMAPRPIGKSLDRIDNDAGYSPDNCRWADKPTQMRNTRTRKTNTSGTKGVSYCKKRRKYVAYIDANGRIPLGRFDTLDEAIEARRKGEVSHW